MWPLRIAHPSPGCLGSALCHSGSRALRIALFQYPIKDHDDFRSWLLGEFLGAIAVFTTLLFLAMQIRHANRTADDSAVVARGQSMREILLLLGRDEELAGLYQRGLAMTEADMLRAYEAGDVEAMRFGNLVLSALVTLQSSWLTDRSEKGQRLTHSRLRWQFDQPGVRAIWTLFRDVHFYEEFRFEADALAEAGRAAVVLPAVVPTPEAEQAA